MAWFDNEQALTSTIIIAVLVLGSVLYGYGLYCLNQQNGFSASNTESKTGSPNPAQQSMESVLSAALSPEARKTARAEHIKLVQRSLTDKFRDVDTYFTNKSLLESAQQGAIQRAENLRDHYIDQLERLYKAQNPRPILYFASPTVDTPSTGDARVNSWLQNIPTGGPPYGAGSEISHQNHLTSDPINGVQIEDQAGSTISIDSRMTHISI
jgi:hypothetical protein